MSTVGVACPQCREVNREARSTCSRCGTPLPVTLGEGGPGNGKTIVFRRGQLIANRYLVQEMIGRGGMGCIYKVRDNTLGEIVVLKTLLPQYTQDPIVVERFFNEARIARQLAHPNVVRVHDIGAAPECVYISMEYVEGKSLRQLMEEVPPGGTIPLELVIRIFCDLCDALQYAHRHTIHRDIKPENVMIGRDGTVKLMDFGISKLMANPNMTATSMVMGTPQYMSPEQLRNSAKVDARADIYSMGVMLYEILTGTVPGDVLEPISVNARHIPKSLDPIIAKCLEAQADKRYATAAELRRALESVAGKASRITPDIVRRRTGAATGHPPAARVVGLLLLLAIGAATAAGIWKAEQDRRAHALPTAGLVAPEVDVYDQLTAVIEQAQLRADTAPATRLGDPRAEQAEAILLDAERLWATSQEQHPRDPDAATRTAREALRKFLAVAVWPEDAAYVEGGSAELLLPNGDIARDHVSSFFIDPAQVRVGDFTALAGAGIAANAPDAASAPVVNVALYDAQLHAARQMPPRQVPTALQYARAISELVGQAPTTEDGADDSTDEDDAPETAGEVEAPLTVHAGFWDWTRTPTGDSTVDTELSFGTPYVVMRPLTTENGDTRIEAHAILFEERSPYVGFRCVLALPDDPQRAAALLEATN